MSSEAFVTLATNDGYALGALVVAQSLRKVGTQRRLVVMVSRSLSDFIRLEFWSDLKRKTKILFVVFLDEH